MKYRFGLMMAILLILAAPAVADDGMWLPHQIQELGVADLGLEVGLNDLYRPDGAGLMSAVVYLGGGTGEFVSARGLILTNHHVAFGAIQRAATPEHDYITAGFHATTVAAEIPAEGYVADVLLGYEDVTDQVLAGLTPGMPPLERYKAIDRAKKEIVAAAEKEGPDIRCRVQGMYSGNAYYLFRFKRLRDVRLVYAPPQAIGNFGGDVDNWMWPRHTGDFSLLRAYVSPDNVGAPYAAENVPYQPKSFLKLSIAGLREGDATFVMGYPGRTYRNHTLAECRSELGRLEERAGWYRELIDFFEAVRARDKALAIKYAGTVKGLNNAMKNYQGKLEGLRKIDLLDKKEAQERLLRNWVAVQPEGNEGVAAALDALAECMGRIDAHDQAVENLGTLTGRRGPTLLSQAYLIHRTVTERQKPDLEREEPYQERNLPYLEQRVRLADRGYDPATDAVYFAFLLQHMHEKAPDAAPAAVREVVRQGGAAIHEYVKKVYDTTALADTARRLALLKAAPDELAATTDPLLRLAADLEGEMADRREQGHALGQERADLKKVVLRAELAMPDRHFAPDANGTIRFTVGEVAGYTPRDAVFYEPFTTLGGVMEKETNESPFLVPVKLKALYQAAAYGRYMDPRLRDVVTCFLNTTNVTGGNSGSPTLNARGEQVGIIFDMTYESVIGDYFIVPELQRTISVDIRYVLFVLDKFAGAQHLLDEMVIVP
ncbi:MAG: S46 family peptidase [Acidobacteria bacterium]|nr:S46 family peptidase [Acidobacteriota bacterium]